MAGEAAEYAASAGALSALKAAAMADAEAAKLATAANVSLAQAKTALAAAARAEAAAVTAAAREKAKAAADEKARAAEAAALAKQWAAARKASDAAAAASAKAAAKEQAAAVQKQWADQKKLFEEQERFRAKLMKQEEAAAKKSAQSAKEQSDATKQAAADWQSSGDLITSPIEAIKKALNGLGPQGQAAAASLAMTAAAVGVLTGAILGGMAKAISVVETMTQRLIAFSALGGGAKAGTAVEASVQRLSTILPFATSQISQWATGLLAAGVPANKLEGRIKAIAAAEALMIAAGGGGGAAAADLFKKLSEGGPEAEAFMKKIQKNGKAAEHELKQMGLTFADVGGKAAVAKMTAAQFAEVAARALRTKGAPGLAAMGNTFDVILMKAKEGLGSLFSGIKIEPFMAAVKGLFGMFNKGSPTIAAIKPIVTSVFGTLFSWATRAVNFVHGLFQSIVIAGLKARISMQPAVVAFRQLWAALGQLSSALGLSSAKSGILSAAFYLVKSAVVGTFFFAIAVITGFVRIIAAMTGFVTRGVNIVKGAFRSLKLPDLAAAAGNMITSFISGITSKIGSVVAAMMSMGAAAKKGLLGALGIASPSRVALEAAGNVTGTFTDKVDAGKPAAQKAFAGLVKAPDAKGGGAGGSGASVGERAVRALERLANAVEMSPGMKETLQMALLEAEQEGAL